LFTALLPVADEAKDYAAFYAQAHNLAVPDFVLGRLEDTVATLDRYRETNRWLDIGCGTGTLLQAAANRGWEAIGTEVAPAAVEAGRAAGFDVRLGETGDLDFPSGHFDVVSLIEVIEHVQDPDDVLTGAVRLLRPGGALYLTTPHGRSLSARLLRTRWSVITPPDHLQLFSAAGLGAALRRAGLAPRRVSTTGINPYELVTGLRTGRDREGARSNTETSYQLNESLSASRTGAVVKRLANRALTATRLGDTLRIAAERPTT
jgi:SAM-dependent methyltransferase